MVFSLSAAELLEKLKSEGLALGMQGVAVPPAAPPVESEQPSKAELEKRRGSRSGRASRAAPKVAHTHAGEAAPAVAPGPGGQSQPVAGASSGPNEGTVPGTALQMARTAEPQVELPPPGEYVLFVEDATDSDALEKRYGVRGFERAAPTALAVRLLLHDPARLLGARTSERSRRGRGLGASGGGGDRR